VPQDLKNKVLKHPVICQTIGPTSKSQDAYDSKNKQQFNN
jgi:hypothetical protein